MTAFGAICCLYCTLTKSYWQDGLREISCAATSTYPYRFVGAASRALSHFHCGKRRGCRPLVSNGVSCGSDSYSVGSYIEATLVKDSRLHNCSDALGGVDWSGHMGISPGNSRAPAQSLFVAAGGALFHACGRIFSSRRLLLLCCKPLRRLPETAQMSVCPLAGAAARKLVWLACDQVRANTASEHLENYQVLEIPAKVPQAPALSPFCLAAARLSIGVRRIDWLARRNSTSRPSGS